MSGLTPVYTYSSATIKDSRDSNATACDNAVCNWSANGYRLPTEGEWEYAASNKGATPYNYASGATANYKDATETQKVAWYDANSGGTTHNVGTTTNSSALTLWDMSGNVWEWCWDWYGGSYSTKPKTNYRGPDSDFNRIKRGGSWDFSAYYLQVGYRIYGDPYSNSSLTGFRIARSN
jgi:formylglycine-generating enzyme required for sulfatase activity